MAVPFWWSSFSRQGSSPNFRNHVVFKRAIEKARLSRAASLCLGVSGCARLALGSLQKSLHRIAQKAEVCHVAR